MGCKPSRHDTVIDIPTTNNNEVGAGADETIIQDKIGLFNSNIFYFYFVSVMFLHISIWFCQYKIISVCLDRSPQSVINFLG